MNQRSVPEKDHAHTRDGSWRGTTQVMRLKQEVHIRAELDPLTRGHGEQSIVIQDRVQGFYPFRVDVTVTNNPGLNIWII